MSLNGNWSTYPCNKRMRDLPASRSLALLSHTQLQQPTTKAHYAGSAESDVPQYHQCSSDEQAEAQGGKEPPGATCLELVELRFEPRSAGVKACCDSMPSLCSCETKVGSGVNRSGVSRWL